MKGILFTIVIVVVLALVGWITINVSSDKPSIRLETDRIQQDVQRIENAAEDTAEEIQDRGQRLRDQDSDVIQ
ncbi:MAG: hypothetical protein R3B96_18320 [Pirellulaceae bacterium]|nr:hypothetical protein [Planctomycetales bacterium]